MATPAPAHVATEEREDAPTKEQLQFARAVYIVLNLWPAMRKAVEEEWGGPESAEKRDFLLSYLCDEYGDSGSATSPDEDDVMELLEGYMAEEYDCQLEDESPAWVAMHVCSAHKAVFEENRGEEVLTQLEQEYARHSKRTISDTTREPEDAEDDSDDDDVPTPAPATNPHTHTRPEPEIDEDGFETVAPRRRR